MLPFLYRCAYTGRQVQGFVAEEVSDDQTYVSITCIMCRPGMPSREPVDWQGFRRGARR